MITSLLFLIMQFIIECVFYMYLFLLPLLLIKNTHSLASIGLIGFAIGLSKIFNAFLVNRVRKFKSIREYYVLGFSLLLISMTFINRDINFYIAILLIFLLSLAYNLLKVTFIIHGRAYTHLTKTSEFLHRPIKASCLIMSPILGFSLLANSSENEFYQFSGVLVAIASLIFLILFNKKDSTTITDAQKSFAFKFNIKKFANKTILLVGFLQGYFWLYAGVNTYIYGGFVKKIVMNLIWLNFPYLLILIWKNVFKMKVWQLKPIAKYVLFIISFLLFLIPATPFFEFIRIVFLGLLLALVQSSDAWELSYKNRYCLHQINYALGFILSSFIGMITLLKYKFEYGFIVLVLCFIIIPVKNLVLNANNKSNKK